MGAAAYSHRVTTAAPTAVHLRAAVVAVELAEEAEEVEEVKEVEEDIEIERKFGRSGTWGGDGMAVSRVPSRSPNTSQLSPPGACKPLSAVSGKKPVRGISRCQRQTRPSLKFIWNG